MSRQKCVTVYSFDELSDDAKRVALDNLYDINVIFDWWEACYEDAKEVGVNITAFDINRRSYCEAHFTEDAVFTANKIKENHGETTDTYKTAVEFLKDRDSVVENAEKDENGDFVNEAEIDEKLEDLEKEFLKALQEDYLSLLRNEYEYLTSEEAIIETIKANEYEFLENGKRA